MGSMIEDETIHFVITGGTLDSWYDGSKDTVVPHEHSVVPKYLKGMKVHEKCKYIEVCMKDSRDINKEDMMNVLKAVEESPHKKIIITHGTYSMPDTGKFLKGNLKRDDQTIILTGSLIPLDGFPFSDAPFNLGYSIARVHTLEPGIYVCMNARIFSPEEVIKFLSQGRFDSLFGEKKKKE